MINFENLSFSEIQSIDKESTIVLLNVSPYEIHGTHLPISTDIDIADFWIENLSVKIEEKYSGYNTLKIPSLKVGVGLLPGLGSISVKQKTLKDLVIDTLINFRNYGFKKFFIVTGHGSPRHLVAIEEACLYVSRKQNVKAIPLSGKIFDNFSSGKFESKISEKQNLLFNKLLTDDERRILKFDTHAGAFETGMMLEISPNKVGNEYKELQEVSQKGGGGYNYRGSPKHANKELSLSIMNVFWDESMIVVDNVMSGKRVWLQILSSSYYKPLYRSHFNVIILMILSMFVGITLLAILMRILIGL